MKQDRVYQSASLIPTMDYISKGISFNIGRHLRFGRQGSRNDSASIVSITLV
jgi:hypothetical protein